MKFGLFQSVQLPEPGAQVRYYRARALGRVVMLAKLVTFSKETCPHPPETL